MRVSRFQISIEVTKYIWQRGMSGSEMALLFLLIAIVNLQLASPSSFEDWQVLASSTNK